MLRQLIVTSAFVLAVPAAVQAQTAPATPPAPKSGPPATTDPATPPETRTTPAEPATSADPTAPTTPATTAATSPQTPSEILSAEFPTYDGDKSGDLNRQEFSKWMLALREKSAKPDEKKKTQAELDTWAGTAFKEADTDKNKKVTQAELGVFLKAGQ